MHFLKENNVRNAQLEWLSLSLISTCKNIITLIKPIKNSVKNHNSDQNLIKSLQSIFEMVTAFL